jgi:hypothetical protein
MCQAESWLSSFVFDANVTTLFVAWRPLRVDSPHLEVVCVWH